VYTPCCSTRIVDKNKNNGGKNFFISQKKNIFVLSMPAQRTAQVQLIRSDLPHNKIKPPGAVYGPADFTTQKTL